MKNIVLLTFILGLSISSQAGVLLQGFYWDSPSSPQDPWWDRLARESQSLSEAGFTAVWLPPVWKGSMGGYSMGYDPFDDYDIGSKDQMGTYPTRWGTREQLQRAAAMMRANGLEVYLDMNITHRKGDGGDKRFLYKNAYGQQEAGRFQKGMLDFAQDISFGRAFDQQSSYVRENLKQAGNWLAKALDAQGLRMDFAKGINPQFLSEYLKSDRLAKNLSIVEYWGTRDEIQNFIHNTGGRVSAFDFPLWEVLREMANGKGFFDMKKLGSAGLVARDPARAVTFVENHDTDRDHKSFNKLLSYAFILTSEGYPTIFWKDYFEYGMKDVLNNLIWIHEKIANGPTSQRWADDDLYIFERTGRPGLLVGLNDNQTAARAEWVKTEFGADVHLQDYSGRQKDIRTNEQGWAYIEVPANSFVAYSVAGQGSKVAPQSYRTTQEFAGAEDLDIKPAEAGDFKTFGRVFVESGTSMNFDVFFRSKESSQFQIRILDPQGREIVQNGVALSKSIIKGETTANSKGFYELQVRTNGSSSSKIPFWWKHTYQAPKNF